MKTLNINTILGAFAAILIGGTILGADTTTAQNVDASGVEILTRGPVHEAFAATVSFDPEPGILVDVEPPTMIEEIPPDQRLEGDNVTWIPGYWAWDEESKDFLWISGIWRNLPPGRQWVPGYWAQADGRYQWTSGYWEDAEVAEISYLPKPPRSLETGPNIEAPSRDVSWLPGSWVWQDERYAWRSGYWAPVRENWIWVPSHYRWTRRGYVYIDGYWDYGVARRGVLFAPVHFSRNVYSRPDFYYTPSTVINISVFVNHLFLRPRYGHYYFGDYYAPSYRDNGYYASYHYNNTRSGFDPIYSYYRWENRDDSNWDRQRREYFEYRRDHEDARPPRTWAALSSIPEAERREQNFAVAQPLDRFVKSDDRGRQRFQAVDKNDHERFVSQREEISKFARERQQLETREAKATAEGSTAPARVKLNRSPVVSRQSDRPGKGEAPPERLAPRASERQATQKGDDTRRNGKTEPTQAPEGGAKVEPTRERDRTERRVAPEPSTKMRPESKREVTPEPSRKEESEKARKETSPAEVREPRSRPESRKEEAAPSRKAEPATPRKAEPTAPSKGEEQRRPEPERKERTEKKQEPQVQQQPSRRVEQAPVEREQTQRSEKPSRRVEPAPVEREQTQRSQQPSRRLEPAPAERRPEPQQAKPERAAPKQVERAPRPETSKEKEAERKKDKEEE